MWTSISLRFIFSPHPLEHSTFWYRQLISKCSSASPKSPCHPHQTELGHFTLKAFINLVLPTSGVAVNFPRQVGQVCWPLMQFLQNRCSQLVTTGSERSSRQTGHFTSSRSRTGVSRNTYWTPLKLYLGRLTTFLFETFAGFLMTDMFSKLMNILCKFHPHPYKELQFT